MFVCVYVSIHTHTKHPIIIVSVYGCLVVVLEFLFLFELYSMKKKEFLFSFLLISLGFSPSFSLSLSRSLFLSFQATIMTFRERTRSARGREKKLDMHFVQIERRENKSRSDNKAETDETRLILRHSSSS